MVEGTGEGCRAAIVAPPQGVTCNGEGRGVESRANSCAGPATAATAATGAGRAPRLHSMRHQSAKRSTITQPVKVRRIAHSASAPTPPGARK